MEEKKLSEWAFRVLNQNIDSELREILRQVEDWHEQNIQLIYGPHLHYIFHIQNSKSFQRIELFPNYAKPSSPLELLGYIRCQLIRNGLRCSPKIERLLEKVPLDENMRQWIDSLESEKWQQYLHDLSSQGKVVDVPFPQLRLMLLETHAEIMLAQPDTDNFKRATLTKLRDFYRSYHSGSAAHMDASTYAILETSFDRYKNVGNVQVDYDSEIFIRCLQTLFRQKENIGRYIVNDLNQPMVIEDHELKWKLTEPDEKNNSFTLGLVCENAPQTINIVAGVVGPQCHVLTTKRIYPIENWNLAAGAILFPMVIPTAAMTTKAGYQFLHKLGVEIPNLIKEKIVALVPRIFVNAKIIKYSHQVSSIFRMSAYGSLANKTPHYEWTQNAWQETREKHIPPKNQIAAIDDSALKISAAWMAQLPLRTNNYGGANHHEMRTSKSFPDQFIDWMKNKPDCVECKLDKELTQLLDGLVTGEISLEIQESANGIDWFDIHVNVAMSDASLSQKEVGLLLKAKGKWVILPEKGWRKLEYSINEETAKELADIGLSAHDFSGEKHRLHALQLSSMAQRQSKLLPGEAHKLVTRRLEDIQTRVNPEQPTCIHATLRPYQLDGFHFLAYLSKNQFGGVLADDMGLGKTLQALTWIAWLRGTQNLTKPSLVIAPKSVQENWHSEARKFFPELRGMVWKTGEIPTNLNTDKFDLLIVNYAQLRSQKELLSRNAWGAVIVDEAQNIKNPTSLSTQACCELPSEYRLALTGTPIENKLMDLWSIFSFAMPGVLGTRASFTKTFDKKDDPLARRRLSARTRPFLLRRTKNEVAKELPERIEEDLSITMEGVQQNLYQAELKRARAHLLKAKLPSQLDKMRFHILTSLLRLRQICCHTALLGITASDAPARVSKAKKTAKKIVNLDSGASAKLEALMDLLEPIMEEGQKILVFSQFVDMLEIIRRSVDERGWKNFTLTGKTENRGALVDDFQSTEGSAIFLISLKAGGSGLNLTAASYVVIFDPWWNPAVEAQAIDRTHRIGQKRTVIAYRLVMQNSIEQKIRDLQKQKSNLANDILGEESFARSLTLDDFNFLLGSSDE